MLSNSLHASCTRANAGVQSGAAKRMAVHTSIAFPRLVAAYAKRREIERDYAFSDLYPDIAVRVKEGRGLPVKAMYQCIECIKTGDHALRMLDIIQQFLSWKTALMAGGTTSTSSTDEPAPRGLLFRMQDLDEDSEESLNPDPSQQSPADSTSSPTQQQTMGALSSSTSTSSQLTSSPETSGSESAQSGNESDISRYLSDWHYRKRFLSRIIEIAATELEKPDIALRVIGDMDTYKLSTYYGKDLVQQLSQHASVSLDTLSRVAGLVLEQRGVGDKGTKAAYSALLRVMRERGASAEEQTPVKEVLQRHRKAVGKTTLGQTLQGLTAGRPLPTLAPNGVPPPPPLSVKQPASTVA